MRFSMGRGPATVSDARGRAGGSRCPTPSSMPPPSPTPALRAPSAAQDPHAQLQTQVQAHMQAQVRIGSAGSVPAVQPSRKDICEALEAVIAQQNAAWSARRQRVLDERERYVSRARRRAQAQSGSGTTELRESGGCGLSAGAALAELLAESRKRWRAHLSSRVAEVKRELRDPSAAPANRPAAINSQGAGGNAKEDDLDSVSSSGADEKERGEIAWSVDELFKALVSGLNSTETAARITALVRRESGNTLNKGSDEKGDHSMPDEEPSDESPYDGHDGIDGHGLLTVFEAPVQSMLAHNLSPAFLPSLALLRRGFSALNPTHSSACTTACVSSPLQTTDTNLDALLRHGDGPQGIVAALRGVVCPSLRRLLYARALQLPLIVTNGTSLFGARAELRGNQIGDPIASCLTFATKHCRDKIRRRMHHSFSSYDEETTAKLLQAVVKVDALEYVGDSDRYFIFGEETEVLALSLVVDKTLLDVRLRGALRQLGHPPEILDAYLVILTSSEPPQVSPCGFFPIKSCSLLIAPICYITGDTVEQYELASAFFGQLWARLQGPTPELAQCCWIFESLVARFATSACLHAFQKLHTPPLLLAMQWMLSGFVGVLEPAELLSFWDLILSYHVEEMLTGHSPLAEASLHTAPTPTPTPTTRGVSASQSNKETASDTCAGRSEGATGCTPCALWLLPLLAASLFVYRAPLVELCATEHEMMLVFQEGHHLRCRPLLQYLLFMAK